MTTITSYVLINPPVITSVETVLTNFIIAGTGTANAGYSILTTNLLTIPLTNWPAVSTGSINPNGSFNYTGAVKSGFPANFYRVRSP